MSADEEAIRQLVFTWIQATQEGDIDKVLSLMTDDVIFSVPGREPFGKETFAADGQKMKGMQFGGRGEIVELKVLGDWAWLRNRLHVRLTPPGGKTITLSGYTLTILQKIEDKWLLARDANMLTPEPA